MTDGLRVEGLSFNYGAKQALDNVGFAVPPGRFCALLGPNGAGKSTLVSLLTRLLVAPGGDIHQQSTLDLDLTVRQNLAYFAALHGLPRAQVPARIDAALDRLGMRERADEKARALNGGHRRRTELARALLHDPRVLLLDEPTVGLDVESRMAITAQVHDLARTDGLCVLWTTHLTDEVRDEDQLLVLHKGQIIADGQTGEIRGDMPLSDWFLAKTKVPA